jgi:hypothetical protein
MAKAFASFAALLALVGFLALSGPSEAQVAAARASGHDEITCAGALLSDGGPAPDAGPPEVSGTSLAVSLADERAAASSSRASSILVWAKAASPIVYVYSRNGDAEDKGIPICTAAGCLSAVQLPGPPSLWRCQSAGDDQAIGVAGASR